MNSHVRRRILLSVLLVAVVGGVVLGLTATNGRTARNSTPPPERGKGQARVPRPPHPLARKIRASRDTSSCNYACTPPNQDALDADAGDAQRIAGRSYYTGAIVHADTNTVELYLASAPQSVLDRLEVAHPGIYVIHNDAPHTNATLLKLEADFDEAALRAQGIDVNQWGPTGDGYLQVGVTSDVAAAQGKLDQIYGPNVVHVFKAEPIIFDGYRSRPMGSLVGAIRTVGGPVGEWRRKGGGLATVSSSRGHAVAAERIRAGHDFRFRLAPGRYRLGFGRKGRQDRAGCPRRLVTVQANKTTHTDLAIGCDWD